MKLPYGYVLVGEETTVHEEKADVVRKIFEHYLAGASLGKIVDMLFTKGILSPTGNPKWTRAAVDKLLANKKYIPIVGVNAYMDAQFERDRRCNVDYDKAGHPRKSTRYKSTSMKME
ncbi:recombinase family protein [Oscillospiraceae bacterium 38-13]